MTRIALAPLLAVTGCNWVFGLEHGIPLDGAPPSEVLPPAPRTRLQWAIATTDGMPAMPGIDPVIVLEPIGDEQLRPALPMVSVGAATGPVTEAPYDLVDGSFEIPYGLRESPHRIVYTLPGEALPHEVQWAVTGATLTVPRTSRYNAPAVPANSGYTISPTGGPASMAAPTLYTSGVFVYEASSSNIEAEQAAVSYRFAMKAKAMAGPTGAPQAGLGDWVLLADWAARSSAQSSIEGWALTKLDLVANTMTMPMTPPMWNTAKVTLSTIDCPARCLPTVNTTQTTQRLNALGGLGGTPITRFAYGISPSTELPGFLAGSAPSYVERPFMMPFAESTQIDSTITLADPSGSLAFERVVHAHVGRVRTTDGLALRSSLNVITNRLEGSLQFPAPLVGNIRLGTHGLGSADTDNVPVLASSGTLALKFDVEDNFKADDFVVTLYEITGQSSPMMAPVRVYHVLAPEVNVDGSLLVSGHKYVFGITARSGYPGAATGDYSKATYPFGSTTTFGRTFVVQ